MELEAGKGTSQHEMKVQFDLLTGVKIWASPPLKIEGQESFPLEFLMGYIGFIGVVVCLREFWVGMRLSRRTTGFHLLKNCH